MAWTQSDLDKLDAAIASGYRRVQFKDRTVEYRDTDQMLKARKLIVADLSGKKKVTTVSPIYDKDVR